jgi:hypothetical protein
MPEEQTLLPRHQKQVSPNRSRNRRSSVEIGESVVSPDGSLRVTLLAFDAKEGKAEIKTEELSQKPSQFYITVKFSKGDMTRIDYKTWDVHKASVHELTTMNMNDQVETIEIVSTNSVP